MKRYSIIFLLLIFANFHAFSKVKSVGVPFIKNYLRSDYNGETQNWDMVQTANGLLYFANNAGVLEFDGNNWRLIPMPNKSVVHSLAIDSASNVYVGAYNEFGMLVPNKQGKLIYKSLVNLLSDKEKDFEEVWQIFTYKEGILFHTFKQTYYYNSGKISYLKSKQELDFSFLVNDKFYVREPKKGLCRLEGRVFELVKGGELFKDIEIVGMLPFSRDQVIIATALNGLYLMEDSKISPWNSVLSDLFKKYQLFTTCKVGDTQFAFGTVRNGLYIVDKSGEVIQNVNTKNGLQNNTVLSLLVDNSDDLWVGLNNGIDFLEISSPLSSFPKEKDLGAGYASIYHNGYLYLGTNTGLYTRKYSFSFPEKFKDEFKLVKNTSGQVWSLQVIDDELICGHDKGTFRIEGKSAELISSVKGGWKYLFKKDFPNKMLGGTYTGLILFEKSAKTNNKWKFVKKIEGFNESSREIVWNDDNSIWMCHGYKGVYRLFLNEGLDSCIRFRFYGEEDGFQSNLNINVHKIRGETVFSSPYGFYKYVPESDRFEEHQYLNNLFGKEFPVNKLFEEKNGDVWFIQNENIGLLKSQIDNSYEKVTRPFASLKGSFINAFENISILDKKNVILCTEGGFVHYAPGITKKYDQPFEVLIRQVNLTTSKDSLLFYGAHLNSSKVQFTNSGENRIQLPYKNNGIQFSYSAPQYSESNLLRYQYQLVGFDHSPSEWNTHLQKEYTNLPEGNYIFKLASKNQYGVKSGVEEFHFSILPPWYRSLWAIVAYVLFFMLCIYCIVFIVRHRVRKMQSQLKKRQEEELRIKEQKFREEALISEREIVQLRNEKLRSEVDFKNRELAGSTMSIIHKNEVLSYSMGELKKALKKIKDPVALVQVRQIIKTMDAEFNSAQDWEQFELHFDKVHEDFLKRLRLQYTQLTPKDLRICAYLRMNLSTKEIAPLMNISVRGVEISRYRLRKKFNLNREENLIDFILNV
ncbi:triple tyrosine motif-containing protein [Labilibaculum sp.]|uniref:triple tyrosine motif-containing protein n=1 Tax=Labilibaculum sp. TaxID=2060723 RepID=UPI003565E49F